MLTVLCAKSLARLKHRQRALEKTRESHASSPDLSAKALTSAPDFWDRQHSAFSYVDSKIQRVKHSARYTTGLLALALVADAGIILAGLGITNAFQRWQTARKLRPVDPVAEQMMLPSASAFPTVVSHSTIAAEYEFDPVRAPQQHLQSGDASIQKNALLQLSVLREDPRVANILAEVAQNDIDYSREVRQLAVQLLINAPDIRTTTLQDLLNDSDPIIGRQALAAIRALSGEVRSNATATRNETKQQLEHSYPSLATRHRQSTLAQIHYWGRSHSTQHVPVLVNYLSDRDASVRESSALALAEINDVNAWIPLHSRLAIEKNPHVRRALTHAISSMTRQR
ncbi:MAG: HEAT repeat domain-containing protein [Cyanobacteria bacterium J06642_2]